MLSNDAFGEELQGEYGKIFNITGTKTANKQKFDETETIDQPCLSQPTSYKEEDGKTKMLSEASDEHEVTSEVTNDRKIEAECHEDLFVGKRKVGRRKAKSVKKEASKGLLYERVAMDLEAVFNKYMMINSNSVQGRDLRVDKNSNTGLEDAASQDLAGDDNKAVPGKQIRYKTVHTENDTLYICTASV